MKFKPERFLDLVTSVPFGRRATRACPGRFFARHAVVGDDEHARDIRVPPRDGCRGTLRATRTTPQFVSFSIDYFLGYGFGVIINLAAVAD